MMISFSPPVVVDDTHVADKGHVNVGNIGTMQNFNAKLTR
jgi:hypothetical protein